MAPRIRLRSSERYCASGGGSVRARGVPTTGGPSREEDPPATSDLELPPPPPPDMDGRVRDGSELTTSKPRGISAANSAGIRRRSSGWDLELGGIGANFGGERGTKP